MVATRQSNKQQGSPSKGSLTVDESIWDFADKIICINLIDRDDRIRLVQQQFAKVGLSHRVSFHRPKRSPHGGRFGCFESHLTVMKQALEDDLQNVLIFEDDVQFQEGWRENVESCRNFLSSTSEKSLLWDAFFLGGTLLWIEDVNVPCQNVNRGKLVCMHAYLVSKAAMESFVQRASWIEAQITKESHDALAMNMWQNVYFGVSPWKIKQDGYSITDNVSNVAIEHMAPEMRTMLQRVGNQASNAFGRLLLKFRILRYFYGNAVFPPEPRAYDDGRVQLALPGMFSDILITAVILMVLLFTIIIEGAPAPPPGSERCSRLDLFRQIARCCRIYFSK